MRGERRIAVLDRGDRLGRRIRRDEKFAQAADDQGRHVFAVRREHLLALDLDVELRVVRERLQVALDVVRHPLLDHEHARLAPQELQQLLGDQRMDRVEDQHRHGRAAAHVGQTE